MSRNIKESDYYWDCSWIFMVFMFFTNADHSFKKDVYKRQIDMDAILSQLNVEFTREQIESLSQSITTDFQNYMVENQLTDSTQIQTYFMTYMKTSRAQSLIQQNVIQLLQDSGLTGQFETCLLYTSRCV